MVEFAHQKVLLFFSSLALRKIDHGDDGAADAIAGNPQWRGADQIVLHLRRLRCGCLDPSQRSTGDHHRNHVVRLQDSSGVAKQERNDFGEGLPDRVSVIDDAGRGVGVGNDPVAIAHQNGLVGRGNDRASGVFTLLSAFIENPLGHIGKGYGMA